MALNNSFYDMSDDEGDRRLSEDDEPQAIEEIVEGEVEAFNDGEALDDGDDIEDLFGVSGGGDGAKKEVKEKKVRKSLGPKLNSERLKGPGGIIVIDELFKDFKMKGRGHEEDDLEQILKRMQKWTHRMYPKFAFADCVDQIERLGSKMDVKNFMLRNRNVPIQPDVTPVRLLDDDDPNVDDPDPDDPAAATFNQLVDDSPPSSPIAAPSALSDEQLERMRFNREAAVRRRMDRMREQEPSSADGIAVDAAADASAAVDSVPSTPDRSRTSTEVDSAVTVAVNGNSAPPTPKRSRNLLQGDDATSDAENGTSVFLSPKRKRTSLEDIGATEHLENETLAHFSLNHVGTLMEECTADSETPTEVFSVSNETGNESILRASQTVLESAQPVIRSKSRLSADDEVSSVPCTTPSIGDGGSVLVPEEVSLTLVESPLTPQADGGMKEGQPVSPIASAEM